MTSKSGKRRQSILIVGGAGYIGSHMVKRILDADYQAVIVDDFSTGHRDALVGGILEEGSLANPGFLDEVFARHRIHAVMHFASSIAVGESCADPARYYRNNVVHTLNLLDAMRAHDVDKLVFSSSAAVYGDPREIPINEEHPTWPLNPYGWTKLVAEQILRDYCAAYGLRSISLRYFNAAGADPGGKLGERHDPETHLIPLVLQVAAGRKEEIEIFGDDYPTVDGTCVRDYVHVTDLCEAHLLALERLLRSGSPMAEAFNLGNGAGFTVLEVIDAVRRVTGRSIRTKVGPRRSGDVAILVADARRSIAELGWQPAFASLEKIVSHAWQWEQRA